MWLQLQSKYPELLWREKGTDGRLICSIKIRRLCWAICNLRTRNGKFKRLFTFFLSFFLHTMMIPVLTEERHFMPMCTASDCWTITIHTNLLYAVSTREKKLRMIVATFFKIHTYFEAKKQTKKIEPVNINLSLISCRKFTCLVRFIFSYSSEKKIRNDIENIQKCTLLWFIYSITQNALHIWFVRKIREKMYFCFISQLLAFKWVI